MRKSTQRSMDHIENGSEHDEIIHSNHLQYGVPVEPNLKIPLKYQRQSKSSSQKHYKKKFRERTWEYDDFEKYDKDDVLSNNGSVDEFSNAGLNNHNHHDNLDDRQQLVSPTASTFHNNQYHKSSKFRPKGKDWDWSAEHHRSKGHENDSAHA